MQGHYGKTRQPSDVQKQNRDLWVSKLINVLLGKH